MGEIELEQHHFIVTTLFFESSQVLLGDFPVENRGNVGVDKERLRVVLVRVGQDKCQTLAKFNKRT